MALIYAVFPDALLFTTVLTNQHIALFFLLLGVLMLLRAAHWWEFALAGLSLSVSDLMRPEIVIVLTACLCCGMLRCVQSSNLATLKRAALSLIPVLVSYWLTKSLTERILIWTDIAPYGIQNRIPEWKFVLGLGNIEGFGRYSKEHMDIFDMDRADRRMMTAELIRDLFRRPIAEILAFFAGKLRVFWTSSQYLDWTFTGTEPDLLSLPGLGLPLLSVSNLQWIGAGAQMLSHLFALPASILMIWKDGAGRGGEELFCVVVLCVTICVFLLIEIQPRYRLFAVPLWLLVDGVFAAAGIIVDVVPVRVLYRPGLIFLQNSRIWK